MDAFDWARHEALSTRVPFNFMSMHIVISKMLQAVPSFVDSEDAREDKHSSRRGWVGRANRLSTGAKCDIMMG
ncbi:hypothetical protein CALVIDRAFT_538568 [Calocera viscosa TUFC12733]|uniref:Uncharacterized protein n=1 Tax=Calocera viscosa (strain TUFC12733) TaxID=1330018 RepID=A0A167KM41_CALVF|nr:hypothetical protein CALVIDRAFT_538568 [Calocera viscosa TUFC12733]